MTCLNIRDLIRQQAVRAEIKTGPLGSGCLRSDLNTDT